MRAHLYYTLAILIAAALLALSPLSAYGAGGAGNLGSTGGPGSGGAGNTGSPATSNHGFAAPGNQTTGNLPPPMSSAASGNLPLGAAAPSAAAPSNAGTAAGASDAAPGFGNFSTLDANRDGTISQDELEHFAFAMADTNHDGRIESTEWGTYNAYLSTAFQARLGAFNTLAANGAGLSQGEFSKGLNNVGYFSNWDTNGDGKIDRSEYLLGLDRYHIHHDANGNITPGNGTVITNSGMVVTPGSGTVIIPNSNM